MSASNSENFNVRMPTTGFKPNEYRLLYSNAFRFRVSPSDVAITFSVVTDHPMDPAQVALRDEAVVFMTLSHAKAFLSNLSDLLSAIEDKFGDIKKAPGFVPLGRQDVKQMVEQMAQAVAQSSTDKA